MLRWGIGRQVLHPQKHVRDKVYFVRMDIRVVVEAGTSKSKTETWVAETKTETKAI